MRKKYDLKGTIRSNSNIMCEMMITSDNAFFNKISLEKTKRYFKESYKFVCNYKNLGENYIVSAAVHLDETTPYMHLVYIPVIHTKEKRLIKYVVEIFGKAEIVTDNYKILFTNI